MVDTLNSAPFSVNETAERVTATTEKKNPIRSELTPVQKNVAHNAVGDKSKICLPALHIKVGLIKISVKAMDEKSEGFAYL